MSDAGFTPVTIKQWLRTNGHPEGRAETVRKLLVQMEQSWGRSLSLTEGGPRLVDAEADRLLRETFHMAERKQGHAPEVLARLLSDMPWPGPGERSGQAAAADRAVQLAGLEGRLEDQFGRLAEEIRDGVRQEVQDFLQHERALMAQERDAQRRQWNEQWAAARRKSEQGFERHLEEMTTGFSQSVTELEERLEEEVEELTGLQEALHDLKAEVETTLQNLTAIAGTSQTLRQSEAAVRAAQNQIAQLAQNNEALVQRFGTAQAKLDQLVYGSQQAHLRPHFLYGLFFVLGLWLMQLLRLTFPELVNTRNEVNRLLLAATFFALAPTLSAWLANGLWAVADWWRWRRG